MRLIDADALRANFTKQNDTINLRLVHYRADKVLAEIDAAPTIEDLSGFCDKLWRVAYERGKEEAVGWIPCSERLPEEWGDYLVTKKEIGWNCEEYQVNDIAYYDREGFHKANTVLAWMPLPEPYKGGEQDG